MKKHGDRITKLESSDGLKAIQILKFAMVGIAGYLLNHFMQILL